MNVFRKIIAKIRRKNNKPEQTCWYNNFHEQKRDRWQPPEVEGTAFCSPNQGDHNVARSISKHQG